MRKVFSSGSCRLLASLDDGRGRFRTIHTASICCKRNINYLGWMHNTKEHLQFMGVIKGDVSLPDAVLPKFLRSHNPALEHMDPPATLPGKYARLKAEFDTCDVFMFELCSMKRWVHADGSFDGSVDAKDCAGFREVEQTASEMYADLTAMLALLPRNAHMILQTHFRRQVIYGGGVQQQQHVIANRETIYDVAKRFSDDHASRVSLFDPSDMLKNNRALFDGDVHFAEDAGYIACCEALYALDCDWVRRTRG